MCALSTLFSTRGHQTSVSSSPKPRRKRGAGGGREGGLGRLRTPLRAGHRSRRRWWERSLNPGGFHACHAHPACPAHCTAPTLPDPTHPVSSPHSLPHQPAPPTLPAPPVLCSPLHTSYLKGFVFEMEQIPVLHPLLGSGSPSDRCICVCSRINTQAQTYSSISQSI